jgi:serine protease AprX
MRSLGVVISLFLASTVAWAVIDPVGLQRLQSKQRTDLILILDQQITDEQRSLWKSITDREKRLQKAYDEMRDLASKSQKILLKRISERGLQSKSFYLTNAILIKSASLQDAQYLDRQKGVSRITLNFQGTLNLPPQAEPKILEPENQLPTNITSINADKVWNELKVRGKGIILAGQDSGYRWDHPAIRRQYRGVAGNSVTHDYNWMDAIPDRNSECMGSSPAPCDDTGHGTHTMGSMLGDDGGANKIGVAPESQWIGCRNMNSGVGKASTYIDCFQFFLAPYLKGQNPMLDGKPEYAPHIINNSWSCPKEEGCAGDEFLPIIQNVQAAGILVVVSAGNEGSGCGSVSKAPAHYSGHILSIGAYDVRNREIAFFSSRGPSRWNQGVGVDLVAPGNNIRSSVHKGGMGDSGLYDYKSGTSMAGPHVAGAIALLWSANPDLIGQIETTWELVKESSTALTTRQSCPGFPGDRIPNAVFGHGLLNVYKLVSQNMKR